MIPALQHLDLARSIPDDATAEQLRDRWRWAVKRARWLWARTDKCPRCGEWIGHFGGSAERDPCDLIPLNVPLEEVRPNCFEVRRDWIGDAIRAACDKKEQSR